MSSSNADLYDIIRQLRTELEWAARTGIIVEHVPLAASRPASRGGDIAPEAPESEPSSFPPERRPSASFSPASAPPERHPEAAAVASRPSFSFSSPPRPEGRPAPKPETSRGPPAWQSKFDPRAASDPEGRRRTEEALVVLGDRPALDAIREVMGACTRCKLHGLGRNQIVFGVGNPEAALMFVGEGPGADEDRQGEPFVGAAGQLLTKIIEAGMGLERSDVYIANVLKCRPPNNRDPEPDEVEQCEPFLRAQIRAIRPKVLVALGKHAAHSLLKITTPITRLRGQWMVYEGVPLMPTFHPAYLLRNPSEKRAVWEDMKEVLKRLGRSPPEKGSGA